MNRYFLVLASLLIISTTVASASYKNESVLDQRAAISSARLNDTQILIDFHNEECPEDNADLLEYRVYICRGGKENLVNVVEATCCKDVNGECQSWQKSKKLRCQGIDVQVDYQIIALGRTTLSEGENKHVVFYPKQIAQGSVFGDEASAVELTHAEFKQFEKNAMKTLVQEEIRSIMPPHESSSLQNAHDEFFVHKALHHPIIIGIVVLFVIIVAAAIIKHCRHSGEEPVVYGQYAAL